MNKNDVKEIFKNALKNTLFIAIFAIITMMLVSIYRFLSYVLNVNELISLIITMFFVFIITEICNKIIK